MDYSLLFNPVTLSSLDLTDRALDPQQLASYVMFYNPEAPVDLQEAQIAIVGVPESRNSYRNGSCSLAPAVLPTIPLADAGPHHRYGQSHIGQNH